MMFDVFHDYFLIFFFNFYSFFFNFSISIFFASFQCWACVESQVMRNAASLLCSNWNYKRALYFVLKKHQWQYN